MSPVFVSGWQLIALTATVLTVTCAVWLHAHPTALTPVRTARPTVRTLPPIYDWERDGQ